MVSSTEPCYVIAEAGVNHNGDLAMAFKLVEAAAAAGVDAVKFQTFSTKQLVAKSAPKAEYQKRENAGETQFEMLKRLELSFEDHQRLLAHATQCGLDFLSSPFDIKSMDFLIELGVPQLKLGSGEITNFPLLIHAAESGIPLIISTGMSYLDEVKTAVLMLESHAVVSLSILHCVSLYPTPFQYVNIRGMDALIEAFPSHTIGFSDHTIGPLASVSAVARGARIIEKHLTLDVNLPGPDHAASMNPKQFKEMVTQIRTVETMLGDGVKKPQPGEDAVRKVARRSLHARIDINRGTVIAEDAIAVLRPNIGLSTSFLPQIIGSVATRDIGAGQPINMEDFE